MTSPLAVLAAELAAEEKVLSDHVVPGGAERHSPALGVLAGSGPRTSGDAGAYGTIAESVREGYLLHYGTPRLVAPPDPDLALLAGDFLYAKGLERLAALGDLEAVRELSDLISISARIHAEQAGEDAVRSAGVLWLAGMVAVAAGADEELAEARDVLAASGEAEPLRAATIRSAAAAGLDEELTKAAKTIGFASSLG